MKKYYKEGPVTVKDSEDIINSRFDALNIQRDFSSYDEAEKYFSNPSTNPVIPYAKRLFGKKPTVLKGRYNGNIIATIEPAAA